MHEVSDLEKRPWDTYPNSVHTSIASITGTLDCDVTPTDHIVSILGRSSWGDSGLLSFEALFIKELDPLLNMKDEYRSKTLILKF